MGTAEEVVLLGGVCSCPIPAAALGSDLATPRVGRRGLRCLAKPSLLFPNARLDHPKFWGHGKQPVVSHWGGMLVSPPVPWARRGTVEVAGGVKSPPPLQPE